MKKLKIGTKEFAVKGAKARWTKFQKNRIKWIVNELSGLIDKGRLNFYLEYSKNDKSGDLLEEALIFHRQQDKNK